MKSTLGSNLLALVGVKSAAFDKEIVTINSQEGKRASVIQEGICLKM